jgi:hypothetical protein
MDNYSTALNAHVNILLECYRMNPDYYDKMIWMVKFENFSYETRMENISALFVIDYMRKRQLNTFLRFTLHSDDSGRYFWLNVDD